MLNTKKACPVLAMIWETAQHLASRIGMDVDLVNLGKASIVMQMQVVSGGRRL
jgi:hypothetical protein